MKLLLITALPCALVMSCVSGDFTYLSDARFPPRPEAHPIEVLDGPPTRPNVRLGNASAGTGVGRSEQACLDALKNQARGVGGDAINDYTYNRAPPGTVNAGTAICRATVFRWN